MSNLLRLRMVVAATIMALIAVVAGGIFDRIEWSLLLAVAVPTVAAIVVNGRRRLIRFPVAVVGVVLGLVAVVVAQGGSSGDVGDAVVSGTQGLLTTEWPSPLRVDLVGTVGLYLAVATALAVSMAGRPRWHLLPLAPATLAFVGAVGLSAPLGPRLVWLLPLGLLGALLAAFRPGNGLADQWALLRGERRMVPLLAIAVAVAAFAAVPLALSTRADPRRFDSRAQPAALVDPIEATIALRDLDPIDLHIVRSDDPIPLRWRTATLADYDGQRWTPALQLRPIGRRLGPDDGGDISFTLRFLDDDLALVPLPGSPVTVGADVETDVDRTVVRLLDRIAPDQVIDVTSRVAPTALDAAEAGLGTRPVDDSVTGLSEFATELAGDGSVLEQLRRIESTMREDWILSPNEPGGGLQRTLIERFVRDTQRGTAEQFATSFVLLARSLGVDARVATGFVAADPAVDGTLTLRSSDAAVWPEVRVVDRGWIAFDPVPEEETSDTAPPPEEPAVQTPAAAQPPIAPPPDPAADTQDDGDQDDGTDDGPLSAWSLWLRRAGAVLAILLVPVAVVCLVILMAKRERRRRRLSGTASARVRGAWAVATDRLVDAGLVIGPSATNGDIATAAVPLAAGADRQVRRMATLSNAVTFGRPVNPELLADDAVSCLDAIESTMARDRSRLERWKWRLSLRSLRRSTRSPVAD